jgi:hypothetical protein
MTAVNVRANGGTDSDDISLRTTSGNIEVGTILAAGAGDLRFDAATAIDDLNSTSSVKGDELILSAGTFAFLQNTDVAKLQALIGASGTLDAAKLQVVDPAASGLSKKFFDELKQVGSDTTTLITKPLQNPNGDAAVPGQYDFESKYAGVYGLFLRNHSDLSVQSVSSAAAVTNFYLQTIGNSDLIVSGAITSNRVGGNEGGVVLVAGGHLQIAPTGKVNVSDSGSDYRRISQAHLTANVFSAGNGLVPSEVTTQFVLPFAKSGLTTPNGSKHALQQAVMNYGAIGEIGFDIFVSYADGQVRRFDRLGETSQIFKGPSLVYSPDYGNSLTPIAAAVAADGKFTVVQRSSDDPANTSSGSINRFSDAFLSQNTNLPTNVIVRRSSDFFLFQGMGSGAAEDIAYDAQAIKGVVSLGEPRGLTMPIAQEADRTVYTKPLDPIAAPQVLIPVAPSRVELGSVLTKDNEVIVYRVEYDDSNSNGQPEDSELPTPEEVLEMLEKGEVESLETYQTRTGGPITGAEIEQLRAKYLNDPSKPTGAYSIIETPPNQSPAVVDTFGLRDAPESQLPTERAPELPGSPEKPMDGLDDEPLIPLKDGDEPAESGGPPVGDGANVVPGVYRRQSNAAAVEEDGPSLAGSGGTATAWLAASVWLRRRSSSASGTERCLGLTAAERFRRKVVNSLDALRPDRSDPMEMQ